MRFISLFAGIGGFDLGFERAGMTCVAQVEIDEFCLKVLNKHWPDVPKFKDIKEFYGRQIPDDVRLFCGGFPCQDISKAHHATSAGLAGTRSSLYFQYERLVDYYVPDWLVIENNPPLLTSNNGRDFTTIISRLVEFGYGVCWRILDARYFGVGCTRRRLYIVAKFADIEGASKVLFKPDEVGAILSKQKTKTNTLPMCVGWDGGLSYERLRQCLVTKIDPIGTRESNGIPGRLDRYRYRTLGNAVVPQVAEFIGRAIMEVEYGASQEG